MVPKQLVVIGASAGGMEALRELVSLLPPGFQPPVCIVLHTSPQSPGVLGSILSRAGPLPALNARDGMRLSQGHVYVAPPDRHLVIEPGVIRVTRGPRENRFRPAIDPLFRSAAAVYGPGTTGVILTGDLDDGSAGLWAVKRLGGIAIVQAPDDAQFPSMPQNALNHVQVDHSVPLRSIAPLLVQVTSAPAVPTSEAAIPQSVEIEVKIAKEHNPLQAGLQRVTEPSEFACPECHGVLLQLKEGGRIRFRCHTGHAYSTDSLLAAVKEGIEESLWNAIRALEEGEMLMRRVAEHMQIHNRADAKQLLEKSAEAKRDSEMLRELVVGRDPLFTKP